MKKVEEILRMASDFNSGTSRGTPTHTHTHMHVYVHTCETMYTHNIMKNEDRKYFYLNGGYN